MEWRSAGIQVCAPHGAHFTGHTRLRAPIHAGRRPEIPTVVRGNSTLNIPLEFSSFFCRFAVRHAVVSVEFQHAEQHACKVTCQCTQCLHVGLALSPLSVVERA